MPELYRFATKNIAGIETQVWRYTNARSSRMVDSVEYVQRPIKSGRWRRDLGDSDMRLLVPPDMAPVPLYVAENPANNLWLQITDLNGDPALSFHGKVTDCSFRLSKYVAEMRVQASSRLLSAEIPRRTFSRGCGWNLYENGCFLSAAGFKLALPFNDVVLASSADGQTLTHENLALQADGYYSGGHVEVAGQRGYIIGHAGDTITLLTRLIDPQGAFFDVYPGCAKNRDDCENKFNNLSHFGGFPFIPGKNPTTSGL